MAADLLGSMRVEIVGDNSKLDKSIDQSKKKTAEYGKSNEKLSKSLKTLFSGIAFAAVAKKLFDITKRATALAATGEEVRSKFNAVFKDGAVDVQKWAEDYATSVGRSDTQTMKFLATLQDTFVPMGIARDTAADFSKQMVELAGDLGSFNDVAQADVINDLQSALVGNHETMRKYGVVINETTLLQEAMNSGYVTSKNEMTEEIKIRSRMNIILNGTTDAQGDLLRTMDSTTNVNAALNSQVDKLLETYGSVVNEGLLPFKENLLKEIKTVNESIKAHFIRNKVLAGEATLIEKLTLKEIEYKRSQEELQQAKDNLAASTGKMDELLSSENISLRNAGLAIQESIEGQKELIKERENNVRVMGTAVSALEMEIQAEKESLDVKLASYQAIESETEALKENTEATEENAEAEAEAAEKAKERAEELDDMRKTLAEGRIARHEALLLELGEQAEEAASKEIALAEEVAERKKKIAQESFAQAEAFLSALDGFASATASAELQRMKENGASQEELDKKKKEIARDEAKRKKALGTLSVGIDTASAIIGFLTDPGGFAGIGLSIAAGITGGIQLAAIAATPLPAFADGGIIPGRPSRTDNMVASVASGELVANQDQKDRMLMEFLNGGGSGSRQTRVIVNLDKRPILDAVATGTRNGTLIVDSRSVK